LPRSTETTSGGGGGGGGGAFAAFNQCDPGLGWEAERAPPLRLAIDGGERYSSS